MSDLFTRPRYFRDVMFHRHTDRTIGWLELFYDLVYVATLIQIGNFLSDDLTLLGFGQFLVLMFVVWWAWANLSYDYSSCSSATILLIIAPSFSANSSGACFFPVSIQWVKILVTPPVRIAKT